MKKFKFVSAMLAVALVFTASLSFTGCSIWPFGKDEPGVLTVKDLPAGFNGKHAFFFENEPENDIYHYINVHGAESVMANDMYRLPQISKGKVDIPIWGGSGYERYSGNDTYYITIYIFDGVIISNARGGDQYFARFTVFVKFSNGRATVSYKDRN